MSRLIQTPEEMTPACRSGFHGMAKILTFPDGEKVKACLLCGGVWPWLSEAEYAMEVGHWRQQQSSVR